MLGQETQIRKQAEYNWGTDRDLVGAALRHSGMGHAPGHTLFTSTRQVSDYIILGMGLWGWEARSDRGYPSGFFTLVTNDQSRASLLPRPTQCPNSNSKSSPHIRALITTDN